MGNTGFGEFDAFDAVWEQLSRIADERGDAPIAGKLFTVVAGRWKVAVNGKRESITVDGAVVSPYHAVVWFDGFPAGNFSPVGGAIAAGEQASVFTLREALKSV